MGCGSSSGKKDSRKIDYEFEYVYIDSAYRFFNSASDLLKTAEEIRHGIQDSIEKGMKLAGTYKLKNYKYTDTVQVMFWSMSACAKGKITDLDYEFSAESPYFKVSDMKYETRKLYKTFSNYLGTCVSAPEHLKNLIDTLVELVPRTADLLTETKSQIENSVASPFQKAKALTRLTRNIAKLPRELEKCKVLQKLVVTAVEDMKELIPKLKEMFEKADEIGAKAYAEGFHLNKGEKTPEQLFDKYHTGERKTPEEIEALKKSLTKKKHAKKGAKAGHGEVKADAKAAHGGESKAPKVEQKAH